MLSQSEADDLLKLEKVFLSRETIEFSAGHPFQGVHDLQSRNQRERFLLDVERGDRNRARLKFQTRARRTIVLARIDINGKAHRNLEHYPHRPGERFVGTHIHLYREGFDDRVAFLPEDLTNFVIPPKLNDLAWLTAFMTFCRIIEPPPIQMVI